MDCRDPSLSAAVLLLLLVRATHAGGLFHFLLGYVVFMPIDERGVQIGLFFALTFTAGHLNHEVRDFELDSRNNAGTNAVAFGKRPAFVPDYFSSASLTFVFFFSAGSDSCHVR
jgi:4-hydroxybenzoate polyprenyltransferase